MGFENFPGRNEGQKNEWRNCPDCKGSCKLNGNRCSRCNGSGKVKDGQS